MGEWDESDGSASDVGAGGSSSVPIVHVTLSAGGSSSVPVVPVTLPAGGNDNDVSLPAKGLKRPRVVKQDSIGEGNVPAATAPVEPSTLAAARKNPFLKRPRSDK